MIIIDEANCECLAIEVGTLISAMLLILVLNRLPVCYGTPDAICLGNGPEMISVAFTERVAISVITAHCIQPGKPDYNVFIERINSTYRTKILDAHLFASLKQVLDITDLWLIDNNEYHPHKSLGGASPVQYMYRLIIAPNIY